MASMKPITVGVVGLGRIGWNFHLKQLKQNPAYNITACVDQLPARRKEAEEVYGCQTFSNIDDFLESGVAELAIICTMSVDHCKHTLRALKTGHHVLVEKPMAMTVREADSMIKAARKAKRVLTVHQSHRGRPENLFPREIIDSGILGKVFWARITSHSFVRRNDWQTLKKNGGGFLNNWGAHAVDSCLLLLDSPVKDVWGDMKHTVTAGDADDFDKVILRGKNGRVIEAEFSYACAIPQPTWLMAGTCGTMQMVGDTAQIKYFDPKKVKPIKAVDGPVMSRGYGSDDHLPWQEKTIKAVPTKPYPDFHANLAQAIRKGKKLLVPAEQVREQIRVLGMIRKSAGWNWKK